MTTTPNTCGGSLSNLSTFLDPVALSKRWAMATAKPLAIPEPVECPHCHFVVSVVRDDTGFRLAKHTP